MSLSESSKHIIQIAQLLEERSMSFSFCLNKTDLSVLCGMALLYQSLELKADSKLMKDNERLVNAVLMMVTRTEVAATYDLKRIASLVICIDEPQHSLPTPPGQSPDTSMAAPPLRQKSPPSKPRKKSSTATIQPQHYSLGRHASISETDLLSQQEKLKRMAMPNMTMNTGPGRPDLQRSSSRASLDSDRPKSASLAQRRDQRMSMPQAAIMARVPAPQQKTNLDYNTQGAQCSSALPAQNGVSQPPPQHRQQQQTSVSPSATGQPVYNPAQILQKSSSGGMSSSEWDALLGQIDGGPANLYDVIYGGPQATLDTPVTSAAEGTWSPDALDLSTFNLGDFGAEGLSEESLSSVSGADDMGNLDFRDFTVGHKGTMMAGDGFTMDSMSRDHGFRS